MSDRSRLIGVAGAVTVVGMGAVALIGDWEGLRLKAYRDPIGIPTVCFGETRNVKMGDRYTNEECTEMFVVRLIEFEKGIRRCIKDPDAVPDKTYVAMISLAYNIGVGGFCKSSIARKWNAGDHYGACDAFLLYTKAGGRTLQGLKNRRRDERNNWCIPGLSERVTLVDPGDVAVYERPLLRRGDRGQFVTYLQTKLGIEADGQFGGITWAHVQAFQRDKGLAVDGAVGPATWFSLEAK